MDVHNVEIPDVPIKPGCKQARILEGLAPLAREEDRRNALPAQLGATFDGQARRTIFVGRGDQYTHALVGQRPAHADDGVAGSAIPRSYGGNDVEYIHVSLEPVAFQPMLEDDQHPEAGPGRVGSAGEEAGPQRPNSVGLKDLASAQPLGSQAFFAEAS